MTEFDNAAGGVDVKRVLRALWKRAWIILLAAVLSGALLFSGTYLFIEPKYEASTMLYVNNSSISVGSASFSISSSDLTAAQSLVQTYLVIMSSRSTLEEVIKQADVSYDYGTLRRMITAGAVNGTEIFEVTVTSPDPKEAERIANAIAVVMPGRIASVVDGSSVRVVDYAIVPVGRSSPSYLLNTLIGVVAGGFISVFIIVLLELLNTTIRSEEYLTQHYADIPLLAVIPDANEKGKGYYRSGYGSNRSKAGGKR